MYTRRNLFFNQTGDISTLNGSSLKLVDKFTYQGSSVSSTEKDLETRLAKAWTASDRLSVIWKSGLTDKGPARTYIQQLCADTGCSPEDLPDVMDDREGWRVMVRNIRADSVT